MVLRAQRSYLAINELDRIALTYSAGAFQPFIPLDPFHGVHRAYLWQGVGQPRFVNVNAVATTDMAGRCEWTWPAKEVHRYDHLTYVAVAIDPSTGQVKDDAWLYSSTALRRAAYLSHAKAGDEYWIVASPSGQDRFARYRLPVPELWRALAPPNARPLTLVETSTASSRDEGTMYEELVAAQLLSQDSGRLALYRPAMDIAGRDLLVQLVNTCRALSLQIKGTDVVVRGGRIQCMVRRNTFRPARDFWLAFYFFDLMRGSFWPYCWLVPSLDFAALTKDQHNPSILSFQVTLDGEDNRWRPFRRNLNEQGSVLHHALLELPR